MNGMPGVTTSVYKPTPTPKDPFPPNPTPTINIVNGKIVQPWQAPPEALALNNPVKGNANAVKIGEAFYNQRCVDCHGKKGYGNGILSRGLKTKSGEPKQPTNLASRVVQANSDGELFWKITNGRSPMPANHQRFTDEQRWYIVTFLRTFK
jgi:mono/diheme cytochrome c family protein